MEKRLKFLLIILVVFLLSIIGGCSSQTKNNSSVDSTQTPQETNNTEQQIVIKGAHAANDNSSQAVPWHKFKEVAEAKSNGRIKVDVYSNGMMGNDNEVGEKVQLGAIQMGQGSTSNMSNMINELRVFELPYVLNNTLDNVKLFYQDGKLGGSVFDIVDKKMKEQGLKLLIVTPISFRDLCTTKEVINPNDIKGMKIRCTASEVENNVVKAFGANPVAMGFSEVYTGLQQGTIDGEGLPADLMHDMKHDEIIKYVLRNKFNAFSVLIYMNLDYYETLPKDIQEIIDEAASEASKAANEKWEPMLNEKIEEAKAMDVKFHEPTETEWQAWRDLAEPVRESYISKLDKDWVKIVQDALDEN